MTVTTTASRVEYTGNGATTAFSVNFYFLANGDLTVYQDGVLKTITTHYTVTGAGNPAGGTVTFLSAPANSELVVIFRDPAITQSTDYTPNDPFPAETHEEALDRLTMIAQRLSDRVDRSAILPDTAESSISAELPTPSAGKALLWNADGDGLENSDDDFNDIVSDATAQAVAAAASAVTAAASESAAATSETNAATSETNAATSETNAATSASQAQAIIDSVGFRDVIFITNANSPYTVAQAQSGKLISVDTSSGAVTINLPEISGLTLPFTVGVKKTTGDGNAVTINRGGSSDIFDDGSSALGLSVISGATLIPDIDTAPDKWSVAQFGATAGQQLKQQFADGADFTAGSSTTITITETPLPVSKDALTSYFDGVYKEEDSWSVVSSTGVITFGSAIDGGTSKIEVVWMTPLAIGTPGDGTVTTAKIADANVTTAKIADANVTAAKMSSGAIEGAVITPFGYRNLLINPDGAVDTIAGSSVADDTYMVDQWYVLTQTGAVAYSALTNPEDGYPNGTRITQSQASAQRFGFAQIIEGKFCKHLRGGSAILTPRIRCSSSQAIRYAILGWTGTEDSVTSDVVNDWTSSTYTANNFFLAASLSVIAVGSQTPSAATWTSLTALTAACGSTFNNIIVMVWTEGTAAQNVTLDFDYVQLEKGAIATPFERSFDQSDRCQRYLPNIVYGAANQPLGFGFINTATEARFSVKLPKTARVPISGVVVDSTKFSILWSPNTGGAFNSSALSVIYGGAEVVGMGGAIVGGLAASGCHIVTNAAATIYFTGAQL